MYWLFAWIGCVGLSPDGERARAQLATDLANGAPEAVETSVRVAAAWQGDDAELDRLLGDALANVLMRPEDGLPLLEAHPLPDDEGWRSAMLSAGMRTGDRARLDGIWSALGIVPLRLQSPTFEQVVARARLDRQVDHAVLHEALLDCGLLNAQPTIGRQTLDIPLPSNLLKGAAALGATRVVLGRPILPSDPDPLTGKGDIQCMRLVVYDAERVPDPLPRRGLVAAASDGEHRVYLNLAMRDGVATASAASDAQAGARWLKAAAVLTEGGDVVAALGQGLVAPP